ncbi:MAG: hypothetical protein ACT4P4_03085 [Betaproteobacteria bacterium]
MLSAWPGAEECLAWAVEEDEGFALAHAASARLHQIYGRGAQARSAIAKARQLAARATPRERAHVEILRLAIEGAGAKALAALLEHVEEHPRDALALSLALGAFGLYAFGGRADHDAARLALCERLAPKYGDDWWFLTHLGWSHTEAGSLAAGEKHTARALELRHANAHAAHAMAHWHVESGRKRDGAAYIERWLPAGSRDLRRAPAAIENHGTADQPYQRRFGVPLAAVALAAGARADVARARRVRRRDLPRPGAALHRMAHRHAARRAARRGTAGGSPRRPPGRRHARGGDARSGFRRFCEPGRERRAAPDPA